MFITLYIIPPLVGGVIGYVTNDIAIRMLFRPHTAKHIMGWRVPFTPGIIPKEKGRIAAYLPYACELGKYLDPVGADVIAGLKKLFYL